MVVSTWREADGRGLARGCGAGSRSMRGWARWRARPALAAALLGRMGRGRSGGRWWGQRASERVGGGGGTLAAAASSAEWADSARVSQFFFFFLLKMLINIFLNN
jgi:hypothetical protein